MKARLAPLYFLALAAPVAAQDRGEVPVTIKELDVEEAIREFQVFQDHLERFRAEVAQGQSVSTETAQILDELRQTAGPENGFNEEAILEAITNYIEAAVVPQVELVDFLESQRYRIAYYANKMASSVRAEDVAALFGTVEQNTRAIGLRVQEVGAAQQQVADLIDSLPEDQFDRISFRPLPGMTEENRRRLQELEFRYQNLRSALSLAKNRLALVRQAQRSAHAGSAAAPDLDVDLLLGQMFGALDRIRLQMSMDLLALETFLDRYTQTAHTQEVFRAFQNLIATQGGLDSPSPGLANMLDWLQESSVRHLQLGADSLDLAAPGFAFARSSELLREAYQGARAGN